MLLYTGQLRNCGFSVLQAKQNSSEAHPQELEAVL